MSTPLALDGRVALITGASRGLGRAAALAYARAGAQLILVARTVGGLEELDDEIQAAGGRPATLVPLDLRDGEGIDRLGGAVAQRWGRLDVLVGNAGVLGRLGPIGHMPPKDWDELIAVNVTANWRLLRAFDPLLRASDGARVIFVTSGAAGKGEAYWGGYAASKAALDAIARAYAAETEHLGIRVNLLSPGPAATAMRGTAFPGENRTTLPQPGEIAPLFVELARPGEFRTGQTIRYRAAT